MLVIRLFRVGKKNQPSFKIVVTDKRNPPRGGRFVEQVGFYNPLTKEKALKQERIQYWLSQGAQPSDTVYNMLVKEGILDGKKIPVHKKSKKEKVEEKPEVIPKMVEAESQSTEKEEQPKEEKKEEPPKKEEKLKEPEKETAPAEEK